MSCSVPAPPKLAEFPARQASGPSRPEVSTGSSYRPSEHTPPATSVIPSSRHTNLRHHLDDQRIERHEQTSTEVTPRQARRSLNFSSSAKSRADDSERVIVELCREISDLKKAARGMSPAKERPRRRLQKSDRERSRTSISAHTEDWAETPSLKEKATSSVDPSVTVQATKGKKKRSDKGVSERRDRSALPPIMPKKKVRRGEQGAVWKALDLVSSSPFFEEIKRTRLPERFTAPRLEVYNGRTYLVAHIGHYQQRMALWHYNDPLMCRMFPSSMEEVALRWFNQLKRGTIGSWSQMVEVFVGRFITNSRRSKGLDTLMMIKLGNNESIKNYSARFWETYNDIDGCGEDTALQTFKLGLPPSTGLRQSLTKCPPTNLKKLMDRVEQFVRVEEDGGNTSAMLPEVPVQPPSSRFQIRTGQASKASLVPTNYASPSFKAFQTVFKEPIYQILDKIKGEPFFVWPPKLIGDLVARNHNLHCLYHRDKGHLTENCHKYKTHLEQLVANGHLSDYFDSNLTEYKARGTTANRSETSGSALAGVIQVIHNPSYTSILPTCFRSDI